MAKMSTGQSIAVVLVVGVLGLLLVAGIAAISIGLFACLAMLLMNVIMPLFDVSYPLTWTQAFGVGGAIVIIRAMLAGLFNLNVKK